MRQYQIGEILQEDELLLKIAQPNYRSNNERVGFLTRLTQKNQLPKAFVDWKDYDQVLKQYVDLPIYVVKETFKPKWKVVSHRFGKSQNWTVMLHPDGYTVEIYMTHFLELVKINTLINGELQGEFKWCEHKLIKKD